MAQPQVQQPKKDYHIYIIVREHQGDVYMLKSVKPRVWTKDEAKALVFHDREGVNTCLNLFFKSHELANIDVKQLVKTH